MFSEADVCKTLPFRIAEQGRQRKLIPADDAFWITSHWKLTFKYPQVVLSISKYGENQQFMLLISVTKGRGKSQTSGQCTVWPKSEETWPISKMFPPLFPSDISLLGDSWISLITFVFMYRFCSFCYQNDHKIMAFRLWKREFDFTFRLFVPWVIPSFCVCIIVCVII